MYTFHSMTPLIDPSFDLQIRRGADRPSSHVVPDVCSINNVRQPVQKSSAVPWSVPPLKVRCAHVLQVSVGIVHQQGDMVCDAQIRFDAAKLAVVHLHLPFGAVSSRSGPYIIISRGPHLVDEIRRHDRVVH